MTEYEIGNDPWRCEQEAWLASEFPGVTQETLPEFHALASRQPRAWRVVRLLHGIAPVFPDPDMNPDDLRTWRRPELQEHMGISAAELKEELGAIRGAWNRHMAKQAAFPSASDSPPTPAPPAPEPALALRTTQEVLVDFGFPGGLFADPDRPEREQKREEEWFLGRLEEWEKLLRHKQASGLARQALLNELQLRRVEDRLCTTTPGSAEFTNAVKAKKELETQYQKQLETLDDLAPWAGALAGNMSFAGTVSDIIQGIQQYRARGSTALIDGIFTATEIQVELRQSEQQKDPRYRAGLVAYLNEARAFIFDPTYKTNFKPGQLRRLDVGFRAAVRGLAEKGETDLPNLESDDPQEGEYEDLKLPDKLRVQVEQEDNHAPEKQAQHETSAG